MIEKWFMSFIMCLVVLGTIGLHYLPSEDINHTSNNMINMVNLSNSKIDNKNIKDHSLKMKEIRKEDILTLQYKKVFVSSDHKLVSGVFISVDEVNVKSDLASVMTATQASIPIGVIYKQHPENPNKYFIETTGAAPCLVHAHKKINPGDPLTISSTPGHATLADEKSKIIVGRALQAVEANTKKKIMAFINIQYVK